MSFFGHMFMDDDHLHAGNPLSEFAGRRAMVPCPMCGQAWADPGVGACARCNETVIALTDRLEEEASRYLQRHAEFAEWETGRKANRTEEATA